MSQFYVTPNLLATKGKACEHAIDELMRVYGINNHKQRIYLTLENVQTLIDHGDAGRLEWLAHRMVNPELWDRDYPRVTQQERNARERLRNKISREAYRERGLPRADVLYDLLTKLAKRHLAYREKHA